MANPGDVQLDAQFVIEAQKQMIADLTWQVTLLTAQLRQLSGAATPPVDDKTG